jgi:hypothetical protein
MEGELPPPKHGEFAQEFFVNAWELADLVTSCYECACGLSVRATAGI